MERVERVGCDTLVLRTRQVGPNSWCCGVYERVDSQAGDLFAFEVFGETEMESVATALHETHEPTHQLSVHR